jgi:hypothetical protein
MLLIRPPILVTETLAAHVAGRYRSDHLRALAQRIEVDQRELRIMGSKSALLRTLAAASRAKTAGFGVPNSEKFGAPLRIKLRTHTL